VLVLDSMAVFDRHRVAGEGCELRSQFFMQGVERCTPQCLRLIAVVEFIAQ
jgi:hypothetical protein